MRQLLKTTALILSAITLAACSQDKNGACFEHPDRFATDLETGARNANPIGSRTATVIQYCKQRQLIIVQQGGHIYCTAESHRGLSRCAVTLDFHFAANGNLETIEIGKPYVKEP